jgi:hypothetical protein
VTKEERTLGHVAYSAMAQAYTDRTWNCPPAWHLLSLDDRKSWEAVANAVVLAFKERATLEPRAVLLPPQSFPPDVHDPMDSIDGPGPTE